MEFQRGTDVRTEGAPPLNSSRARFALFGGSVACALAFEEPISSATLRSVGRDVAVSAPGDGRTLFFELETDTDYYLNVDGKWFYFFVDLPPQTPTDVLEIQPRDALGDVGAVQRFVDYATRQGKTLVFAAGEFLTAPLRLRSKASLYLSAGAVLRFGGVADDDSDDDDDAATKSFLNLTDCSNCRIAGPGALDPAPFFGKAVYLSKASDVSITDVTIRSSRHWAVHVHQSRRVSLDRVKIFSGCDGVDPDSSAGVDVHRCFIHAWDDAVAVKATSAPTSDVSVRRSVVSTRKSALKIGTETLGNISNVTFSDVDVFAAGRGAAMYAKDGGAVAGVTFERLRMFDFYAYAGESAAELGRVFDFELQIRGGDASAFRGVSVDDVYAEVSAPAVLKGDNSTNLSTVSLRNVVFDVVDGGPVFNSSRFLFDCHNGDIATDGVAVENLTVRWNRRRIDWRGISAAHPGYTPPAHTFSLCDAA
ncbi:pectin lyase fold/virulence factor [Pelagophyceae sp. CCMP2097]|nr:pectin lyase fold/virulence factor [Pelagophyceae sp. CCMP2097]